MLCIVPLAGPLKGQRLPLQPGASLGRDADCDARLVHRSVSRRHARVERDGETWWLVDDGSRNGLFEGRQKTDRIELADGLLIKLGDYPLRVELGRDPVGALAGGLAAGGQAAAPPESAQVLEEDLEFLDSSGLDAGDFGDHGLELEDPAEIQLGATQVRPVGAQGAAQAPAGPTAPVSKREIARAAVVRGMERDRSGLLRGDLSQQPGWVQGVVWLGVLGVGGAIAAGIALLISGVL